MFDLSMDNLKLITLVCGGVGLLIFGYLFSLYFKKIRDFFRLRRFKKDAEKNAATAPSQLALWGSLATRKIGLMRTVILCLSGAVFILLMLCSLSFLIAFEGYKAFLYKALIAEIEPLAFQNGRIKLAYTPIIEGREGLRREFEILGDEWRLAAMVVLLKPHLNQLGLHSRYCLTHLTGFYHTDVFGNRPRPRTAHTLITREHYTLWRDKERRQLKFPYTYFVDSVYRESVGAPPDPARIYLVYITDRGGLMLKPRERNEYLAEKAARQPRGEK